jgi:alginate O-acetyltransferase complex protein AlgI
VLFNSHIFLLAYLPIVLFGFFWISKHQRSLGALWLFLASLVFYGWWNPVFVTLLLASIVFNYRVGLALSRERAENRSARALRILQCGIGLDLAVLAYFKYANFLVQNVDAAFGMNWHIEGVLLPVGISFFTFTQIAFLVDAYRGEVKEANFIHYGLFVTYFPHLIAGPVLHHKEMMPQFAHADTYKLNWENVAVGMTIFSIGLFKKVVLADNIAPFASPVFAIAAEGGTPTLVEAWGGVLAYTFQLYFDFSAYSDMAIGLSRLFGVKLPLNFNSPYKSVNMVEFWRRWHMTLSRFLRDYLYIALGGNRNGPVRRYANLITTMVLGGLWHGAGWTFLIWGTLHGAYLVINHGWQQIRKALGHDLHSSSLFGRIASTALTFFAVVAAWVFFRAENLDAAIRVLHGMAGVNGLTLPARLMQGGLGATLSKLGFTGGDLVAFKNMPGGLSELSFWLVLLSGIVWLAPNTQQIMANFNPAIEKVPVVGRVLWKPNTLWMVVTAIVLLYAFTEIGKVSEFLYFQF